MRAPGYLKTATQVMEDRAASRDKPGGERSMARCVETFNAMTGHVLSEEDGWMFMQYLKHSRMQGGAYTKDDYVDSVAYSALMAEAAEARTPLPVPPSLTGLLPDVPDVVYVPALKKYVGKEDFEALGIKPT
jgi:hypothetical protein